MSGILGSWGHNQTAVSNMSKDVAASNVPPTPPPPPWFPREQTEGLLWDKGAMNLGPQAGTLGMGSKTWPKKER